MKLTVQIKKHNTVNWLCWFYLWLEPAASNGQRRVIVKCQVTRKQAEELKTRIEVGNAKEA